MTQLQGIPSGSQVAGVDEVGRGCLFGPVFAAAVVLEPLFCSHAVALSMAVIKLMIDL